MFTSSISARAGAAAVASMRASAPMILRMLFPPDFFVLLPRCRRARLDRPPDPLRGCRHLDVLYPERGQRIDDRASDGRQRPDGAGLAGALDAQWICLGQHLV